VLSKQLRLEPAQLTDVGRKRPHNEDNMAYVIPKDPVALAKKGALFIVADGMGGHAAGEVASEIAVDTVSKVYYQDDSDDVLVSLVYAVKRANTLIHQRAAENMLRSGMGTTCVAAVLRGSTAYIVNVGDSRAYFIHNGQVRQISQDHSWVAEQVRAGLLTEEQARSHAQRNVITRSLGTQPEVEVDTFVEHLEEGDFLILCSDGLSGLITDSDLLSIVSQYQPQESVYHLVERANENGGPDNITVIVARVQEVGWEPSGAVARQSGAAGRGSRAVDEATMPLPLSGGPGGTPNQQWSDGGRATGQQFHRGSGPLVLTENAAKQQPVHRSKTRKHSRLLYPTLALFIILIIAMVAGGTYYLMLGGTTDASLESASSLLKVANAEVKPNPSDALKKLAQVQAILRGIHGSSLNDSQSKQLSSLQNNFVAVTKAAITSYNTQSNITVLPCAGMPTNTLNTGSTGTHVTSIGAMSDTAGTMRSYALGDDGHLYQISSNYSLINPLTTPSGIQKIASDGSRILALSMQQGTKPSFSLHLLVPTATGLQDANASTINTSVAQDGSVPTFLTAWGSDVYVVLTSSAAQNTAYILDYTVGNNNKLMLGPATKISISNAIVSVAAWPGHQLFILYGDGSVQRWIAGSQAGVSAVVQQPIPTPLSVSAQKFTLDTPVPQVTAPSSVFLTLPGTKLLIAGTVNKAPHLYIVDAMYRRVLDLQAVSASAAITTTLTTTPTPTASANGSGGGVATSNNQVKMQLVQQYASHSVLANVKDAVADPQQPVLYLLTLSDQGTSTQNIVALNAAQSTCTP
jgi:serine/threonine protein phosphatase PrpC